MPLAAHYRFMLLFAPLVVWVVHFLVVYPAGAVLCASNSALAEDLAAIVNFAATAIGLLAIVAIGSTAFCDLRYRHSETNPAADSNVEADDQRMFLASTTIKISVLSAIAVVFGFLPALLSPSCS